MRTPTVTFPVNTDNEEAMENVHIEWVEFKFSPPKLLMSRINK